MTICQFNYHSPDTFVNWKRKWEKGPRNNGMFIKMGETKSHFLHLFIRLVDDPLSTGTSKTEIMKQVSYQVFQCPVPQACPDLWWGKNGETWGHMKSSKCSYSGLILASSGPSLKACSSPGGKSSNQLASSIHGLGN